MSTTTVSVDFLELHQAEGAPHEAGRRVRLSEGPDVFASAQAVLSRWSWSAPRPESGYYKVDVVVGLSNGQTLPVRYDMSRGEYCDLRDVVHRTARFYAAYPKPELAQRWIPFASSLDARQPD